MLCASIHGVTTYKFPVKMRRDHALTPAAEACLPAESVNDGVWHTVTARRFGHQLLLEIDDADQFYERNDTVVMLAQDSASMESPHKLLVDKQDGICLGGKPHFDGINVVGVEEDFYDSK